MRYFNRMVLWAGVFVLIAGHFTYGEEKIDVLIVTGFDVDAHKWEESAKLNQAILGESERFDVEISQDKEVFASPSLSDYDVLVLNFGFLERAGAQ